MVEGWKKFDEESMETADGVRKIGVVTASGERFRALDMWKHPGALKADKELCVNYT